jgi:LPXTG-motif cell wall-anchored protein
MSKKFDMDVFLGYIWLGIGISDLAKTNGDSDPWKVLIAIIFLIGGAYWLSKK